MSTPLITNALKTHIGVEHQANDLITPRLANSLAAILEQECTLSDGNPAPLGIHWCLAPEIVPMSALGTDGHPMEGTFLPPMTFASRMWAGGSLRFYGAFIVGDKVQRVSRILNITEKVGRSGSLCFITLNHDYFTARGLMLSERQDLVFRSRQALVSNLKRTVTQPLPDKQQTIEATPILLARYSAVTGNAHRIHYDRDYCCNQELYPGLLVHGPLQATLLLQLSLAINTMPPSSFDFRATAPLFDKAVFMLNGKQEQKKTELWITDAAGNISMEASAFNEKHQ